MFMLICISNKFPHIYPPSLLCFIALLYPSLFLFIKIFSTFSFSLYFFYLTLSLSFSISLFLYFPLLILLYFALYLIYFFFSLNFSPARGGGYIAMDNIKLFYFMVYHISSLHIMDLITSFLLIHKIVQI